MERSTVDSILRSTQAYCQQVCETQTLDYGIVYYSERFADLPDANQFREVLMDDPAAIPVAFDQAQRWFQERGLFCYRWAPAGGQPTDALSSFLKAQGFRTRPQTVMALTRWMDIQPVEGVRIHPARATRAAFQATLLAAGPGRRGADPALVARLYEERLDDPQYDMFVAMVEGNPAACCALYQVGDIARVMDLTVLDRYVDRHVDRALLAHVLAMARRLAMRNIYLQIDSADTDRIAWYETFGFVADGDMVEFERDRPHDPDPR